MIRFSYAPIIFIFLCAVHFCKAQVLPIVTSCKAGGKEMLQNEPLQLSAGIISFSFDYNLPGAANAHYMYMLQGFDTGWMDAGSRTYINYTNMPGGNYKFMLKASSDGAHWLAMNRPVEIIVNTAFYRSAWFIIFLAAAIFIVALLVIYFAQRVQLQRLLMAQKIRNNIASDLHDDIGSSLSSIMLMSEVAKKQPAETVNYLSQITETAQQVIENMNDIVWAINPNNDSMEQMLIRMQRFASALLEKKNIALQFLIMPETETIKLAMEERKNFYLIFKETIHNAFKYAECSKVVVQLKNDGDNIVMKIEDDGRGFDTTKKYMGNGLYNLNKRATEINGRLEINSAEGSGTTTTLIFKTTQTGG